MYKATGLNNVTYWQVGYDPNLYYPEPELKQNYLYDISFCANTNTREGYPGHHERLQTAYLLRKTFESALKDYLVFSLGFFPNSLQLSPCIFVTCAPEVDPRRKHSGFLFNVKSEPPLF